MQNPEEKTSARVFLIKKETLAQIFSCDFCEISKKTFFTEHLSEMVSEFSTVAEEKLCEIFVFNRIVLNLGTYRVPKIFVDKHPITLSLMSGLKSLVKLTTSVITYHMSYNQ